MKTAELSHAMDVADWLKHIVALHFDFNGGAPFWLEQREALGFDPLVEVKTLPDLVSAGLSGK